MIRYLLTLFNRNDSQHYTSLGQFGWNRVESFLQPDKLHEFVNVACCSKQEIKSQKTCFLLKVLSNGCFLVSDKMSTSRRHIRGERTRMSVT